MELIFGGLGRNFTRLWSAMALSRLGDGIYEIGLMMLVYHETGSPQQMAFTLLMYMLPIVIFGLWGGVVVDRGRKRQVMVTCDLIRASLLLIVPLANYFDLFSVQLIWGVTFCLSAVAQFFNPAASALLPLLVPKDKLIAANSRLASGAKIMEILGPVIGGVMAVSILGAISTVWMNCLSFLFSALLLVRINGISEAPLRIVPASPSAGSNPLTEIREGLSFIMGNPWMRLTLMLTFIANTAMGPMNILLPIYSLRILRTGSDGYGYLMGSISVGCVLGSLVAGKAARRFGTQFTATLGTLIMALGFGLSVLTHSIWGACAFMAVAGSGVTIISIPVVSRIQQVSPQPMLGRVFGAVNMVCALAMPLGTIAVGAVLKADNVDRILIASAVILAVAGAIYATGYGLPEAKSEIAA